MLKVTTSGLLSYSVAVLAVVLALLLALLVQHLIAPAISPLFFAAVTVSAWYGDQGPGLLAAVLAVLVTDYFFISPLYALGAVNGPALVQLGVFSLVALLSSSLNASLRSANQQAKVISHSTQHHDKILPQSQELYRLMEENVKDYAILLLDPDGRIASWNLGAKSLFGYQSVEIIDQPFSRLFSPEDIQSGQPEHNLRTATATGRAEEDRWYIRKNGTRFWASGILTALRNEVGSLRGFSKVLRDMTERQQAEEALRESEERFFSAILNAPYPLMIHAEDGEVIQISKVWTELTGYAQSEISTIADWTERAYGQRKDLVKAQIEQLYSLEARVKEGEYIVTTSSGETRIWDFSSAALGKLPDGRRLVISMAMDITKRKLVELALQKVNDELELRVENRTTELSQANEQLQREIIERELAAAQLKASLQEKEVLLKEVHHRVKNNFQIISSLLNLQGNYIQNEQCLELFIPSLTRINSMALVHEKLYQSENLAQVDLAEYVRDLVGNLLSANAVNPEAIALKINIGKIYLGMDVAIPCGLIINELVLNSFKHAFPGVKSGEIRIDGCSESEHKIILTISDNGIGLPPDLDFRNTKSLGLQLIGALIDQLGGTIELNRGS